MSYSLAADFIVGVHVLYVSFVLGGQVAILLGWSLRWAWVRRPLFRLTHLAAIAMVAAEALAGIACPLTVWEDRLRAASGQEVAGGTFIGRCLHNLLFYDFEPWVFTVCYVAFALLVAGTLVLVPPRRRPDRVASRAANFGFPRSAG
jgi:hypothetical protein